jgi:hypothetical protein
MSKGRIVGFGVIACRSFSSHISRFNAWRALVLVARMHVSACPVLALIAV